MKTTLGKIWDRGPCGGKKGSDRGWDKLITTIGTDEPDAEVAFAQILGSNGVRDAVWSLCVLTYIDRCLFMADVAESVLHVFGKNTPYRDNSARRCIEVVRMYHAGQIDLDEFNALRSAVYADAYATYAAIYVTDVTTYSATTYLIAAPSAKWREIEILFKKHFCAKGE